MKALVTGSSGHLGIYVNERARAELGWRPRHSPLARRVGAKGYRRPQ